WCARCRSSNRSPIRVEYALGRGVSKMSQTLTVNLPSDLYVRIKKRADDSRRSVEDEAIELLAATVPAVDSFPSELQQALASLALLDSTGLEHAARSRLAAELATELE